jgi:hypothetical protein
MTATLTADEQATLRKAAFGAVTLRSRHRSPVAAPVPRLKIKILIQNGPWLPQDPHCQQFAGHVQAGILSSTEPGKQQTWLHSKANLKRSKEPRESGEPPGS